jgi:hypothetical protein
MFMKTKGRVQNVTTISPRFSAQTRLFARCGQDKRFHPIPAELRHLPQHGRCALRCEVARVPPQTGGMLWTIRGAKTPSSPSAAHFSVAALKIPGGPPRGDRRLIPTSLSPTVLHAEPPVDSTAPALCLGLKTSWCAIVNRNVFCFEQTRHNPAC